MKEIEDITEAAQMLAEVYKELEISNTLMDMNLTDHAFDLDTTSGPITLTSTSGLMLLESDTGGTTIRSAKQAASAMLVSATGSHSSTTLVIYSAGTGVSAVDINSSGGFDLDAAGDVNIDTTDTSDGIKLGAGVSGVPITLGHTTSALSEMTTIAGGRVDKKGRVRDKTTASSDIIFDPAEAKFMAEAAAVPEALTVKVNSFLAPLLIPVISTIV